MTSHTQHIQALLFTAGEAVSKEELCQLSKVTEEELAGAIHEMSEALRGTGLAIIETATHVELVTSPAVAEFLAKFQREESTELSRAASETLAIIAYRGPISRYDVDMLRGVDSRGMIRQLLQRGIVQRLQRSGRTPLYDITEEFLKHMGITNRTALPQFEDLKEADGVNRLLQKSST
ncbi:MAG: SMC-Scp complex subunit ScpB [Candidatus Andersenbacteria bacterium]|nr:SMC-Scp complex subunit ScpB [Candidatus Andersenbacteria bacterium]MBI3250303.1 SMC-Scp complex subunit ScpB [Candidatus Andersenbacteria bacterium]